MAAAKKAFVLGAGLGTRLRPLTESLPKPLVPVANKPLLTYALDHLREDLGIEEFLINTHHCPECYGEQFPDGEYHGCPIEFRHEPVLLDTAGGIENIRDWLPQEESFVVYNGDILTDLPLARAWEHHVSSGNLVTMILRSLGDELRVGYDAASGRIVDLRGVLQPDWSERYQFTGIYFVSPQFLSFLQPGKIESVVIPLLQAIRAEEKVGGFVADEGCWSDLGERESYLDASALVGSGFRWPAKNRIASNAQICPDAKIDSLSSIGSHARVGQGAQIEESVLWPGAQVADGAILRRVVVRDGQTAEGHLENVDL